MERDELNKKFYKINQVAEMLGLPASTLRFWETKFTIIKPHRGAGGIRYYTPADIDKLRMVHYLVRDKGLRLEAAEEQIRHNHSNVSRKAQTIERLRSIRATLVELLHAANTRPSKV